MTKNTRDLSGSRSPVPGPLFPVPVHEIAPDRRIEHRLKHVQ